MGERRSKLERCLRVPVKADVVQIVARVFVALIVRVDSGALLRAALNRIVIPLLGRHCAVEFADELITARVSMLEAAGRPAPPVWEP